MKTRLLSYIAMLLFLSLSHALPAQSGSWSMAGVLLQPAVTAVTLNDGRVMVVGSTVPGSSQVWNKTTNTWAATATAPLTFMSFTYAVVVLNDGRVLVTGFCASLCASNAEIYSPATNTWSLPGQMSVSRYQHTATKLTDGRVLVAGGCNAYGCATDTASVEIFDPKTNRFMVARSMILDRADHAATLLADGRVLISGGFSPLGTLDENEIYNPRTNTWAVNSPMAAVHALHTATLLANGKVLVTGGEGGYGLPQGSAEVFNPGTGLWSAVGAMANLREYHQAVRLPNGKVLVAGGASIRGRMWVTLASAEVFDPTTNRFSPTGSMQNARQSFGMTMLQDGRAIAVGGDDYVMNRRRYPGDAEVYKP